MDIFTVAAEICKLYRLANKISNLFVDQTASLIDSIGNADFSAAEKCLSDASKSLRPDLEFRSAITILRSCEEMFSPKNKSRVQCAILIATCYKVLGEDQLVSLYTGRAKDYFREWIESNKPVAAFPIPFSLVSRWLIYAPNESLYTDFKKEINSLGIPWKGLSIIGTTLASVNSFIMNEEISTGCSNAICVFDDKLDEFLAL